MQKILREKSEEVVKIKEKAEGHALPFGILLEGSDAINQFLDAKGKDMSNEMRPT